MILDTNVVSEPLRISPNLRVMTWLDGLDAQRCYITAITAAELLGGVERLPHGQRRARLEKGIDIIINRTFAGRVLPFDLPAARSWAVIADRVRRNGLNGVLQDTLIAAIAVSTGKSIITRDTKPFAAAGVNVINPWTNEADSQK